MNARSVIAGNQLAQGRGGESMMYNTIQKTWIGAVVRILLFSAGVLSPHFAAAQPAASQIEAIANELRPTPPSTLPGQSATLLPSGQWLLLGGEGPNRDINATATL